MLNYVLGAVTGPIIIILLLSIFTKVRSLFDSKEKKEFKKRKHVELNTLFESIYSQLKTFLVKAQKEKELL